MSIRGKDILEERQIFEDLHQKSGIAGAEGEVKAAEAAGQAPRMVEITAKEKGARGDFLAEERADRPTVDGSCVALQIAPP